VGKEIVTYYRGQKEPLKEGESMKSRNRRNGNNHNAETYPPAPPNRAHYPKGLNSNKAKAVYDHRHGGMRFRGAPLGGADNNLNNDPSFPGSPFIALAKTRVLASQAGIYVYEINIPADKWRRFGIGDVVLYLKEHGVSDPAAGAPNVGMSTHEVEALYGDTIPYAWVTLL